MEKRRQGSITSNFWVCAEIRPLPSHVTSGADFLVGSSPWVLDEDLCRGPSSVLSSDGVLSYPEDPEAAGHAGNRQVRAGLRFQGDHSALDAACLCPAWEPVSEPDRPACHLGLDCCSTSRILLESRFSHWSGLIPTGGRADPGTLCLAQIPRLLSSHLLRSPRQDQRP